MRWSHATILLLAFATCLILAGRAAGHPATLARATLLLELLPVSIAANDFVYDWQRDQLYASVSGDQGELGNSIVPIMPDGRTGEPIFIGSEPNVLALSGDANFLYVGLDGAAGVRRLNLTTMTPEPQWPLGVTTSCGLALAADMVVLVDAPDTVAVSRRSCWPSWEGAAVYDGGVMRPTTTPSNTLHNQLEPSLDPNILFSLDTETSGAGLHRLSVTPDGLTIEKTVNGLLGGGTYYYFVHAAGELYDSSGHVVDGATLSPLGSFTASLEGSSFSPVAPDPATGRVFFLTDRPSHMKSDLEVFDRDTFRFITSAEVPYFAGQGQDLPVELIVAGPNRLAFRTLGGGVYWLRYTLLENVVYLPSLQRGEWEPGGKE